MTQTPNLDLPLIAPGQTNKHLTANEAVAALEAALSTEYAATLSSTADHTLPYVATEGGTKTGLQAIRYRFTGTPGGAVNVLHPAKRHLAFVVNDTPSNIVFKTAAGSGPTILPSETRLVYCDGTNISEVGVTSVVGSLNSITDVDAPAPADGTILQYDSATSTWKPVTASHGQMLVWVGTKFELRQPYERATSALTAISPVLADIGKLVHCTAATAIQVTLPLDATLDFPDNARLSYLQKAAGQIEFVAEGAVVIKKPAAFTAKSHSQECIVHAIKTGNNEWTLAGGLELVP